MQNGVNHRRHFPKTEQAFRLSPYFRIRRILQQRNHSIRNANSLDRRQRRWYSGVSSNRFAGAESEKPACYPAGPAHLCCAQL
jgi:hypothetical protein